MIKLKVFEIMVEIKKRFIETVRPNDMKDYDGKGFTRVRKLMLARILMIILRCSPFGLQTRLDDYYEEIGHKEETVSKQAFSKARAKLDPDIIKASFVQTAQTMASCEDIELYRGKYRLCAIDGSDIILDNAQELFEHFGGSGANKDCVTGLASLCYDPLNDTILDGGLYPYGTSEREAARKHFDAVAALPLPENAENLYIFDRGYPSKELFADMIDSNMTFLMRVRKKFNVDFDSAIRNEKVSFFHNDKQYYVRIFKVTLNSGEQETLVTNLRARHLGRAEVASLYFERWHIETKFDTLKNKLQLENMSGRRVVTTYQDFWAKLDLANMIAALGYATDDIIEQKNENNANKYTQTTNQSRLITKFADRYIEMLSNDNLDERRALFDALVADITRRPIEVKPNRQSVRKHPKKKKFCDRRKPILR